MNDDVAGSILIISIIFIALFLAGYCGNSVMQAHR